MTVASNQFQSHNQLLRHGMLNWVTRGVFLGYQRNYLELQVDDLFLGDDAWDPATHATSFDPAQASRMTPADVTRRSRGRKAHGLRLDFAFNGGGSELYKADNNLADGSARRPPSPIRRRATRSATSTTPSTTRTSTARPRRSSPRRSPTTSRGAPAARPPVQPQRGDHRRALGPGEHASRQPGHHRHEVPRAAAGQVDGAGASRDTRSAAAAGPCGAGRSSGRRRCRCRRG